MAFVRKWSEHAVWPVISQFRGGLSVNFIRRHAPDLTWSHVLLNCSSQGFNLEFVRQVRAHIHWPALIETLSRMKDPNEIVRIATEFADKLDLPRLVLFFRHRFKRDPPEAFLDQFFEQIGPLNVSKCVRLSGEFLVRHAAQLNWKIVSARSGQFFDSEFMRTWGEALADWIMWPDLPLPTREAWAADIFYKFSFYLYRV